MIFDLLIRSCKKRKTTKNVIVISFQTFFLLSTVQIVDFLRRKTTYSLETIRGPVGGQVKSVFVVSSSWQCGYWFNYLKVMPVFICLSGSLFFFPNTISTLRSDLHISLFLPPQLSSWFSVHPCLHALGPPPPYVDISHSLPCGLGSVCSLPFCGAQLLCLPGASTGVKPL